MKIIVPSLGRAGTAKSMSWLRESGREILFAVHPEEAAAYQKAYPDCDRFVLSEEARHHTGIIRKEIMKRFREPFFFVDDDIRISLKEVTEVSMVFDMLESHMKAGATMAGIAPQLFSNFAKTELINGDPYAVRNKFVATVYAIDPIAFDDCPLEQLPVYEDVALVIHAIQSGNGTICSYIATHNNVSPGTGGCNAWRNEKITIESLITLCRLYPDICSIKETKNTTHSQNIGIGLKTAWSKIRKLS
jgi:hypothetical protein